MQFGDTAKYNSALQPYFNASRPPSTLNSQPSTGWLADHREQVVQFLVHLARFGHRVRHLGAQPVAETLAQAVHRRSDSALVQSEDAALFPQTVTIQKINDGWFITSVDFFDAPAFCR